MVHPCCVTKHTVVTSPNIKILSYVGSNRSMIMIMNSDASTDDWANKSEEILVMDNQAVHARTPVLTIQI